MKLKYLLPAATIASVAAAITPFVTACNKAKTTATYVHGKNYHPMTPKKETKVAGTTEQEYDDAVTKLYHDDLVKNKFIFADDMVKVLADQDGKSGFDIKKVSYTTTKVGKLETVSDGGTFNGYACFRISFKVYLDGTINGMEFERRSGSITDLPIKLHISNATDEAVSNDMDFETNAGHTTAEYDLSKDEVWSANMPNISESGSILPGNTKYTHKDITGIDSYKRAGLEGLLSYVVKIMPSHYYKHVIRKS